MSRSSGRVRLRNALVNRATQVDRWPSWMLARRSGMSLLPSLSTSTGASPNLRGISGGVHVASRTVACRTIVNGDVSMTSRTSFGPGCANARRAPVARVPASRFRRWHPVRPKDPNSNIGSVRASSGLDSSGCRSITMIMLGSFADPLIASDPLYKRGRSRRPAVNPAGCSSRRARASASRTTS